MPDRLISPGGAYAGPGGSASAFIDISQLVTSRLRPLQLRVETNDQQIAHHKAEIRRLAELAEVLEQAVTALVIRQTMVSDNGVREALLHNRADLQRFKDEMDSVRFEHLRAIERIRERP
jgi:hypothetical protein